MAVVGEVVQTFGSSIDGPIPAIDENVSTLADLPDHDVESIDVVVADLLLEIVSNRGDGREHHVGVRGLLGGVDDSVEVPPDVHQSTGGVADPIGLERPSEIVPAHGDVGDVRPERLEQFAHRVGDRLESGERSVAADDRGSERNVGGLESIDDAYPQRSADLVADQEHESLVFGLLGVHGPIVVGEIPEARV